MTLRPFAIFLACAMLIFGVGASSAAERQWFADGATPLRYEIAVAPDVNAGAFTGEAIITVELSAATPAVTLNALDLEVIRASIDGAAAAASLNAEAQTLTLTPRRALAPGRHTLRISYRGKVNDEAYGLFRVTYKSDGGEKRALTTQFEAADARRFAPMWDQPNLRAVFSLTVTAPSDQLAVSNMPVAQATTVRGGLTRTRFADTPAMPSYLLFLAVGDFERVTRDVDGVSLSVVARRGEAHRTEVALDAGEAVLRYYNDYFGVKYPLPKLDMVAVPGAGGFGAMENWGAILYFEQYLLVDETSSEAERQNVFDIVAHEVAHQWFGNLVTMAWWDDLWLNEGYASWMEPKVTEVVHADQKPWLAALAGAREIAMTLDARAGTHPIVQTINTLEEASLAFDGITYQKGQSVIRMLEAYVGEEPFRNGVRAYMQSHLYGSARTEELLTALQAASGAPVIDIAHSFTLQQGFPLVSASAGPCVGGRQTIGLTQRRFAADAVSRTDERWHVPIVVADVGGAPQRLVMTPDADANVELACGAYLVNAGQSGFYRVLYERANLTALTSRFASLGDEDKLGLLSDYWAFGRSGDAPFGDYLDLVAALPADASPLIVSEVADSMNALALYARGRPSQEAVRAFARDLLRPHLARVGWTPREGETPNETLMRANLIEALGHLGDETVIGEARTRAAAAQTDRAALPGAIRNAVMSVNAYNATPEEFDALLAQVRAATDFIEVRRQWRRLAGVADAALARRVLDLALGEDVPRQLRTQVLAGVAAEHPRMAWDYLVAHRADVEALLDPLQRLEYPAGIAATNAEPAVADELAQYAANFPEGAGPTIAAAQAQIRLRAQTIAERMPAVEAWIGARNAPASRRAQRRQ